MNLTDEQKAIGKENFDAAIGVTRRSFLKRSVAAGVVSGGGLGAFYYGYGKAVDDPVRVGVIGTGDEGSVLIGAINPDFVQVVAIADIRSYSIYRAFHGDRYSASAQKARCGLLAKYGWKDETEARKTVKVHHDYMKVLDDPDVEAVIIALPLHLHAEVAIEAMRKGKHVLTEKLMGKTIAQCKDMARVSAQEDKYLVTGHQRHYNILYANAMDTIQNNLLGDIHYIRAQWHRGNVPGNDSWKKPLPPGFGDTAGEAALLSKLESWQNKLKSVKGREIEVWKKKVAQVEAQIADRVIFEGEPSDAEKYGYKAYSEGYSEKIPAMGELIRWRLFNRTGGGLMAELGSHQLDAAGIFISAMHEGKKQAPLTVAAAANRPIFPADRDVDDHVYCIIEFPGPNYESNPRDKIGVTYSSINGNGFGGYGEVVMGTKGTLILEKEKDVMLFGGSIGSRIKVTESATSGPTMDTQESGDAQAAVETVTAPDVSRGYLEEIEHWAWCIRNQAPENQPRCHPKVALGDAVIALTTNIAARQGKRIEFNPKWFDPNENATPEAEFIDAKLAPQEEPAKKA
ncbi:MAG: Gfo/Idh/MocA family oxidoreductase [Planctomycetes bacterium]|nr:Gfo/Idh/MocA family oxidoreductase [Planctomycetota bacterium]